MMGMGGIGAAFSGFAQGAAQGLKLRSDLDDAEQRRGLTALQTQQAKLALDTEQQLSDLQKGIAKELQDYTAGAGAYAPQEGMTYDATNPTTADLHYSRLGAMLKQQAILARKDPLAVDQSINTLRKERFSERVMQASNLLRDGDAAGLDLLKPVYNNLFRDGRTMTGGTYDQATDSFNITYKDKDGNEQTRAVKRQEFSERLVPMALNAADAAKLLMQQSEAEKGRNFTAGENRLDRGLRLDISRTEEDGRNRRSDNELNTRRQEGAADRENRMGIARFEQAGADRRGAANNATSVEVAKIGAAGRGNSSVEARYERNYDDFRKELPNTFGYDPKNPLQQKGALEDYNSKAALATEIWKATASQKDGINLSGPQVRQVMEAVRAGKETVLAEKDGYRLIEVGSIRAVVPAPKK